METVSLGCDAALVGSSAAVTSVCEEDWLGVVDRPGFSATSDTVADAVVSVLESVFGIATGSEVEVGPEVEVVSDVSGSIEALVVTDSVGVSVSGLEVALVVDDVAAGEVVDVLTLCVVTGSDVVVDDVGGSSTTSIITVVVVVSVGGDVVKVEEDVNEGDVDKETVEVVVVVVGVSVDVVKLEVVVSVDVVKGDVVVSLEVVKVDVVLNVEVVVGVDVVLVVVKFVVVVVVVGVSVVVVRLLEVVVVVLLEVVNVVVVFVEVEVEVVVLVVNEVVVVFKLEVIVVVVVALVVKVVEDCVVDVTGSDKVPFKQAASEK